MQRFLKHGQRHLVEVKYIPNPLLVSPSGDKPVPPFECKPYEPTGKEIFKTVYFVRHGQSESNVARAAADPDVDTNPKFLDAKLTEHGRNQASALRNLVSAWNVELVIASPLTRTLQTACLAFHEHKVPIRAEPLVTEYYSHLVECVGRELSELRNEDALRELPKFRDVCLENVAAHWWNHSDDLSRQLKFLDRVAELKEERVCVVSHFGTINTFALHDPTLEDVNKFFFPFPFLSNCDAIETKWALTP